MISIYQIKPAFQKLLQPILKRLHGMGVSPNQLTMTAIVFSIGLGGLLLFYPEHRFVLLLVAVGLLLRMALNALDGMMARQFKLQSKLGEVLNELGDVVSDLAIVLPLALFPDMNLWIIVGFAVLAVINEFAGLLGKAMGGDRRYDGPMGKSDRALLIGLFCVILFFWPGLQSFANWIFGLGILLLILSTFTRIRKSIQ
ncbi:MAG: CDP-alcohol phosphatidyltransferase family protein [Bacteroidota bacterium]